MNIVQVLVYLIVIVILVNVIRKRKNKRFYQLLEQFPSNPTYPLIGNAHFLLGSFEGLLERLEKYFEPFDRMVYWMGPIPCLCLKKYDDIAIVLNQNQDRDTLNLVDKWIGLGILTARYEEWKKSRKILTPGFTSGMLSKYDHVFNKTAQNLVEKLKPAADTGEQIDVLDCIMNSNLDAIIENSFGVTIQNCGKPGENFCKAIIMGLKHTVDRVMCPLLFLNQLDTMYLKVTGRIKAVDDIKHLPTEILKEKLNDYHDHQSQNNATDGDNAESSKTIIDLLIKNGLKEDGLTETRMRDELLQVISAGIETTALSISFLMLMLAMNQDIQQKVYEEIIQQTPDDETAIENHSSNNLDYLEQCIKETMRMYSPVMLTTRRTNKEIILKDNTIIPSNILVAAFIHFANYDPNLYENPEKWDPEHFSDRAIKERPKTSQLSFGYGPRSCIGNKYAMMSIKIQIAHILRNYHLSTNIKEFTKCHLKTDLSIRSKIGYPIKLTSRQKIT